MVKFSKGHDSVNVGRVEVLILYTTSDDALYLYEISLINLQLFSRCGAAQNIIF